MVVKHAALYSVKAESDVCSSPCHGSFSGVFFSSESALNCKPVDACLISASTKVVAGMRFFRQLSEFRLKGDWEKDSFCHFHAVFEAQL